MNRWEKQLVGLEKHILHLNSAAKIQRFKAWLQRFEQIKSYPECRSLDDLGIRLVAPTVDLSVLYPHLQKRAAA